MPTRLVPSDRRTFRLRYLKRVLWAGCGLLLLWLVVCTLVVISLTSRSRKPFTEAVPPDARSTVEQLRLSTVDGETIGAWYIKGKSDRPTVILIHGNGGQRLACWPQAEMLIAAGYPVLLITCRAHGDSTGKTNDFGFSARHDVVAAVKWLKDQSHPTRVVIWGMSLGSAAAIFAAAEIEHLACGYILECPYQDLETAVWHRLEDRLPPVVNYATYRGMRFAAGFVLPQITQISPVNCVDTIPQEIPILILAGGADRRARPFEAEAIHKRVADHCELKIFPDADHLQLQASAPNEYRDVVLKFLDQIKPQSASSPQLIRPR